MPKLMPQTAKQITTTKTSESSKKNIHVFIDGREANTQQRVGSNVYAYQILLHLHELWKDSDHIQVTVGLTHNHTPDMPQSHERWQYKTITPTKFWTQWGLPLHLFANRNLYDVVFSPSHYAPRISPVPTIITIFDLAFLSFPDQFKKQDFLQLKHWTAYSAKQAKKIITISNYSKKTILDTYKRKPKDVIVAYPSADFSILPTLDKTEQQSLLKKIDVSKPYLLYLGTIQPRKNIEVMIEAFEHIKRQIGARSLDMNAKNHAQLDSLQFIIAGKVGWLADPIIKRIQESSFSQDIKLVGFVDEKTKWALLAQAQACFQLGSQEGFGIPALEALSAHTSVIAYNNASLPEVIGKAGFLVNSISARSLNTTLKKVLSQTATQRALQRKLAKDQISQFSWEESAKLVAECIEETAR